MSERFWKNLSYLAGLFSLVAVFALLVFAANIEIKDLDLWLHIGMGRYIVTHGFTVPSVDVLSCTIAGKPWVNHEWLFQIIVYYIHQMWGPDGLIMMQVIVVTLTMTILLLLGYSNRNQFGSVLMLLLVTIIYQGRFTIRPDLYSLLFFASYIFILSQYIHRKWSMYALIFIQLLWSNVHGFFFFGPLFVLIGIAAEWIKRHVPLPYEWNSVARLTDDEYRRMRWIFVFVVLACLFNPLTFQGAWYPISVFFQISVESKIFFEKIIELKRPISWDTLFSIDYSFYKLIILLSFVSFYFNRRKLDIGVFIFWLIFLLFSLAAIRNLIFFAFAAYLAYATNALGISIPKILPFRIKDRKFMHMCSIVLKGFLTMWIMQYGLEISLNGYFDFQKYQRKSEYGGVSLRTFPDQAADFLVENNIKGNFFNDFNSGAYLVGRCSPNIKVFIDGRTEVYGPAFFKEYQKVFSKGGDKELAKVIDKYHLTGVLMNFVHSQAMTELLRYLYNHKDWALVYFDYDAMVFLKDIPENRTIIDRFRIDLNHWQAKELDLFRIGSQKVSPYPNINRAYALEGLGFDDQALAEVEAALKVSPNYSEPYKLRGKIYGKKKDFLKAFENFRIAVTFTTEDQNLRMNMALACFDLKKYKYAAEMYQKIIDRWPGDPAPHFYLAKTLIKQQLYEKALRSIQNGIKLDPTPVEDILKLGDLIFEDKQYKMAQVVYGLMKDTKNEKDQKRVHHKMGLVYQALGDEKKAQEEFEKGKGWDEKEENAGEEKTSAGLLDPETTTSSANSEIVNAAQELWGYR